MVNAVKDVFAQIYSIELGMEIYQKAKNRFAGIKKITILQGDSGEVLKELLAHINSPCLFWLDAHYSPGTAKGNIETPIVKELTNIFEHPLATRHVILIDDASWYTGERDYPTIDTLRHMAESAGLDAFEVNKANIICIHRRSC